MTTFTHDAPTIGDRPGRTTDPTAPTGPTEDVDAIRAVVAAVEDGFNRNDAETGVEHFAADAWAVTVTGARVVGRDALLESHRAAYAGPLRDQHARYEVSDVNFLRADVALVHKEAYAVDEHGEPLGDGPAMVALYVMVREAGRWWIAARHNTLVAR